MNKNNFCIDTYVIQEINILQQVYFDLSNGGYSHNFCQDPLKVYMSSTDQMNFCSEQAKRRNGFLYIDTTSYVIQSIQYQRKQIFHYACLMDNPLPRHTGVPVTEMLTSVNFSNVM